MKRSYLFLIALLSFAIGFGQQPIQLDSTNAPYIGWSQKTARDTFPVPTVDYGQKGANQVYDFSNLELFDTDTIEYRALTPAQKTKFPTSTIATTQNGASFLFSKTTATGVTWQGLDGEVLPGLSTDVTFNPEPIVAKFLTQYGSAYSGSWGFAKTVSGADVGQPSVDKVRLTYTGKYTDTIDGWGKVITPFSQYKCLRDQRYETSSTKIEASLGMNIFFTVSDTKDTTKRYTYLTKESRGSALTFTYDTSGVMAQAAWTLELPNAPVAGFTYTVAGDGEVTFADTSDNYPTSWSWDYGDNSASGSIQNPTHTYTANGNYYVCLTVNNDGGSNTFCDSVRITTIGVANQKPVAEDDWASVEQPNSATVNVLANDADPDQNALTITIIEAPQHGTAQVVKDKIEYSADANFIGWDTLQYAICDNGSPVLCDSAYVFIEVKEQVILPQAVIDSLLQNNYCGGVFVSTSLDADSIVWKLTTNNHVLDTIVQGDTLKLDNSWFGTLCIYAYNKFGADSACVETSRACDNVGIDEVEDVVYTIYPNPSAEMFYIKNNLPFLMGVKHVRLIDLQGRVVREKTVGENSAIATIETKGLPAGSYIAEIVLVSGKIGGRVKVMLQ